MMHRDNHVLPFLHLASRSPRRRMMMRWLGIPIAATQADVDETPLPGELPEHLATRLARMKAQAAITGRPGAPVLAADTVVEIDSESLGKPADAAEAREMLLRLREGGHQVHTGVALAGSPAGQTHVRRVTTDVAMRPYTDAEVEAYIATGDPMDKAGAYAIQHQAFGPVDRLQVCYANVVGLPLCAVVALLQQAGLILRVNVPTLCYLHFGYRCPGPDAGVEV